VAGQVRRLRRDRHQRPAEQGIPHRRTDASSVRSHRSAELSVLTRGHTLRPEVILLGGPNTYHPRHARGVAAPHSERCEEREARYPTASIPKTLIVVPENAQYLRRARRGRIRQGRGRRHRRLQGMDRPRGIHPSGRKQSKAKAGAGSDKDPRI
jgi:hypothetical protein